MLGSFPLFVDVSSEPASPGEVLLSKAFSSLFDFWQRLYNPFSSPKRLRSSSKRGASLPISSVKNSSMDFIFLLISSIRLTFLTRVAFKD